MKNIVTIKGNEYDLSDPDFIPNLMAVSALIKVSGKPEVSDMVINTWSTAHMLKDHIIATDSALSHDRLIRMVKFLLPLIAEVVPQVGKLNTSQPASYNAALIALQKILEENDES